MGKERSGRAWHGNMPHVAKRDGSPTPRRYETLPQTGTIVAERIEHVTGSKENRDGTGAGSARPRLP